MTMDPAAGPHLRLRAHFSDLQSLIKVEGLVEARSAWVGGVEEGGPFVKVALLKVRSNLIRERGMCHRSLLQATRSCHAARAPGFENNTWLELRTAATHCSNYKPTQNAPASSGNPLAWDWHWGVQLLPHFSKHKQPHKPTSKHASHTFDATLALFLCHSRQCALLNGFSRIVSPEPQLQMHTLHIPHEPLTRE